MKKKSQILAMMLVVALLAGQLPWTTLNAMADGEKPKATVTTPPTGNTLPYNGDEQELLSGGEADTSLEYSEDGTSWGSSIPKKKDVNTYTIYYRAAGDSSHDAGDSSQITAKIETVPLSITAKDHSITYGDTPANNGVEYSGFKGGDTESVLSGSLSYVYSYSQYGDIGSTYTITPSGLSSGNYEITYNSGTLTVNQKEVGLDWSNTPLTFTGVSQAPGATATGTVNNDEISVTVTGGQTNVGTGYTATASGLTGDKAGNYKLPSDRTKTFSIGKAGTRTLSDVTSEVAYQTASVIASVTGLMPENAGTLSYAKGSNSTISKVTSWDVDSTTGQVNATLSGGAAGDVITLPVKISSTNYEDSTVEVKFTLVNKTDADVTITGDNPRTVTFGDNSFQITASAANTGANGAWTWESNKTGVATVSNTGIVTIIGGGEATITASYESDTTIGSATLRLKVNPKSLTVPVAETGLKWTGSEQTGVASGTGYSLINNKAVNVGNYTAVATLDSTTNYKWSDGTTGNKSISWSIGKADSPAAPTGLTGVAPTTSGGSDGKITGVTTDMEYSSNSNFSSSTPCSGTTITGLSAGTYYVRLKETGTKKAGSAATVSVPEFTAPKASAEITKLPVAKTGLVYSGEAQELITAGTATGGTLKYALTVSDSAPSDPEYSTSVPSRENAMKYYVWYKAFGDSSHNDTDPARLEVVISKKEVTLSGISASKTYDGSTTATITANITGKAAGDDLQIRAEASFTDPDVGSGKTVTYTGLTIYGTAKGNYTYSGASSGTLKADITKRPLTITARDQTVKVDKKINKDTYYVYVSNLVDGHVLSSITLKSSSTEKVTDHGTITPSGAVIKSGSTDVTNNYAIYYIDGTLTVKKNSSDSDSDSSSSSSGGGSSGGYVGGVNYNELRAKLLSAAMQINAQKAANGGVAVQQQIVTWDKGDSLPYDVMKTLQDNPNIMLVFKCTYGGINYVFTIPGSAVKANPLIPWYGPLYLFAMYGQYAVAVPSANASMETLAALALLNQNNGASGLYVVKKGDNLSKIARMYNTTVSNLAALNGIKNPNKIYPGQVLRYTGTATQATVNTNTSSNKSSTTNNSNKKGTSNSSSTNSSNSNKTNNSSSTSSNSTNNSNNSSENTNNSDASNTSNTSNNSNSSDTNNNTDGNSSGSGSEQNGNNSSSNAASETSVTSEGSNTSSSEHDGEYVWVSDDGNRYHAKSSCSGMTNNVRQVTIAEAKDMGRTACGKCHPPS